MSDFFGIGNAMLAAVRAYSAGARRSGRTTCLVERLRDGDRVVCADHRQAETLRRECGVRGVRISVLVMAPDRRPGDVFNHSRSEGRTLFDHTWLEAHYAAVIESERSVIEYVERESSGHGDRHRETARAHTELHARIER